MKNISFLNGKNLKKAKKMLSEIKIFLTIKKFNSGLT